MPFVTPFALLAAAPALAGWREDAAAARAACAADPAPCAIVDGLFLRENRAGQALSQDPRLAEADPGEQAALTALVLERLLREDDAGARRGLADAALELFQTARSRGDARWDDAWVALVADPQADVRALMVDGLRRAPLAVAAPGLRAAAAHADPLTRADAARNMGGHAELPAFEADLAALAADRDPGVRSEVARALRRLALRGPLGDAARAALAALDAEAGTGSGR